MNNNVTQSAGAIDDLTGLPGREALLQSMGEEAEQGCSGGVFVVIELDNLAGICRRLGTGAGNLALKLLAQSLQGQMRDKERVFRTDGGIFVLMLGGVDPVIAAGRAQSIVKQLNRLTFIYEEEEVSIFTSLCLKPYGGGQKSENFRNMQTSAWF